MKKKALKTGGIYGKAGLQPAGSAVIHRLCGPSRAVLWLGNGSKVDAGSGLYKSSGRVPAAKESGQFAAEEKTSSPQAQGSRWRI